MWQETILNTGTTASLHRTYRQSIIRDVYNHCKYMTQIGKCCFFTLCVGQQSFINWRFAVIAELLKVGIFTGHLARIIFLVSGVNYNDSKGLVSQVKVWGREKDLQLKWVLARYLIWTFKGLEQASVGLLIRAETLLESWHWDREILKRHDDPQLKRYVYDVWVLIVTYAFVENCRFAT